LTGWYGWPAAVAVGLSAYLQRIGRQ